MLDLGDAGPSVLHHFLKFFEVLFVLQSRLGLLAAPVAYCSVDLVEKKEGKQLRPQA